MKVIGGGLAMLVAIVVSLLPVHISETTRAEAQVLVGAVNGPPSAEARAQRTPIEVAVLSGGPVIVEHLQDGFGFAVALPPQSDWTAIETGFRGENPASPLIIDAAFRQLNFTIRSADGGPSAVQMSIDGSDVGDVMVLGLDPIPVQVESGVLVGTSTHRFAFRGIEVAAGTQVTAWLGPIPLDVVERDDGTSIVRTRTVLGAVVGGLWSTVNIVGVAMALLVAFVLFGWAMLGERFEEADPTVAVALGAAVPALLLGSLNYLLPVRLAAPLVAAAMAAIVVTRIRRAGLSAAEAVEGYRSLIGRASITGPLLIGVVFVGLPAALTHNTNLGMLQTDIFDYMGVQQTYWNTNIVAAGLDWGDGLRSIHSSVRSAAIGWTHLSPMEGFTAVRFTTILVALTTVGGACRALGARTRAVVLIQIAVVSTASVTSLWVEGYLSREMFIWIVVPTLTVPMTVLGGPAAQRGRTWVALGAIFAWPAALVPPFMVTLIVPAVGLVAIARSQGWAVSRQRGLLFSAAFLGLFLPNSRWVFNIEKANEYSNRVENIGKVFVVPFHADPEFPAAALGLTGFHSNDLSWQGPKAMDGFGQPVTAVLQVTNGAASSWTTSVIAMVVLALAAAVAWSKADARTRPKVVALLSTSFVVAVAVPILIDTSWEAQSFFVLMWVWTMSALLLIPILIGASLLRGRSGAIVAVPLAILMAFNVGSSLLEMTMWFSHPQAQGAVYHHYDVAADVLGVRQLLDSGDLTAQDFRIERPVSVTARDDDDRVLFNHLARDLQRDGALCLNCIRDTRNGSVAALDDESGAEADMVLVLGANHCVDGELLYQGVLVALCDLEQIS